MRLDELLGAITVTAVEGDVAVEVGGVAHDSRRVVPGDVFCCVPGAVADGHDFAPAAVAAGAVALVVERRLDVGGSVTQVVVPTVRAVMGPLAATLAGEPSRSMAVVGVTGTNGKTTVTHLLRGVFEAAGRRATTIGTLTGTRTTPEGPELQAELAALRDAGTAAVAMEVSSHALAQHRVDGTWFAVGVFTNLSRDHLDFHQSMEEYFKAKASLFQPERCGVAVVNVDDPYGRLLRDAARVPTVGYGLGDTRDLTVSVTSSRFRWRGVDVQVPLGGRFNAANAVAAATAAAELGIEPEVVARGLAAAGPVPGRFELIDAGQPFPVIVDYAHTPDGVEQLLLAAREVAGRRVILVFGAGGDRDRAKRPAMGEAASRLADHIVLTSDNPRNEEPRAIIESVRAGMAGQATLVVEPDRRAAIALALAGAGEGDVVVVAGKGHETTQTFADRTVPFDDRAVTREELARLAGERRR